jgi:hypothetical protein
MDIKTKMISVFFFFFFSFFFFEIDPSPSFLHCDSSAVVCTKFKATRELGKELGLENLRF